MLLKMKVRNLFQGNLCIWSFKFNRAVSKAWRVWMMRLIHCLSPIWSWSPVGKCLWSRPGWPWNVKILVRHLWVDRRVTALETNKWLWIANQKWQHTQTFTNWPKRIYSPNSKHTPSKKRKKRTLRNLCWNSKHYWWNRLSITAIAVLFKRINWTRLIGELTSAKEERRGSPHCRKYKWVSKCWRGQHRPKLVRCSEMN